ncbi:MAG: hypothetical protein QXQ64_09965 [Candidatus Bathyarchaeia archaeon]
MDREFWGNVLWWMMSGLILLPFVFGIIEDYREKARQNKKSTSSPVYPFYIPPSPNAQASKAHESTTLLETTAATSSRYRIECDSETGVKIPPPQFCRKLIDNFESEKDVNKAVKLLSKYYRVPAPLIIFDDDLVSSKSALGLCRGNTIYLTNNPDLDTLLHEFLHYLFWLSDQEVDRYLEEEFARRFAQEILKSAQNRFLFDLPPPNTCMEILCSINFESVEYGLRLLATYYGVKNPRIEYDETLRKDSFHCTKTKIYFSEAFPKLSTVLAAFYHFYARNIEECVNEQEGEKFASEMIKRANEAIGLKVWNEGTIVHAKKVEIKMWKHMEESLRKSLGKAFPQSAEIVEQLLKRYGLKEVVKGLETMSKGGVIWRE